MTFSKPTYIQSECYTAQDDRLQIGGLICAEGVSTFSGFRVTQTSVAGTDIEISAGHIYVANDAALNVGGYYHVYNDAAYTFAVPTNPGGTRTDYVWLRIIDTQYAAGVAGASIVINQNPVAPSDNTTYYLLAVLSTPTNPFTITGYPTDFENTNGQITDKRRIFKSCTNGLIGRAVFTGSGTFNISDYPGAKNLVVRVVGGGAAGGGAVATSSNASTGSGGGGGAYAESTIAAHLITAPVAVTVGAGGTGVNGNTGNNGGTSSFGALVVAGGGSGGGSTAANTSVGAQAPGAGGSASAGGIQMRGGAGGFGLRLDANTVASGFGGSTTLGGGAQARTANGAGTQNGVGASANTGGGGSGATNCGTQSACPGGTGGSGIVIVDVY